MLYRRTPHLLMRRPIPDIGDTYWSRWVVEEFLGVVGEGKRASRVYRIACSECGERVDIALHRLNNRPKRCPVCEGGCKYLLGEHASADPQLIAKLKTAWLNLHRRCYDPGHRAYKWYGAEGVRVTFRRFEEFLAEIGLPPSLEHSVDRIHGGDYGPGNVRWATKAEQRRNCRNTINFTYVGETKCLADWANFFRVNENTVYRRLRKYGWSIEDALLTPVGQPRGTRLLPGSTTA